MNKKKKATRPYDSGYFETTNSTFRSTEILF